MLLLTFRLMLKAELVAPSVLELALKYNFNSLLRLDMALFIIASQGCLGIVPSTKMLLDITLLIVSLLLIKCFPLITLICQIKLERVLWGYFLSTLPWAHL